MISYVKNSTERMLAEQKNFSIFDDTTSVVVKDKLTNDLSIRKVLNKLQKLIPQKLVKDLDAIYVGQFEELQKREIESYFLDGIILITNDQVNEEKMLSSLIHEIAHSVEKNFTDSLYFDGKLKQEFIGKRKKLYSLLADQAKYKVGIEDFLNIDYNKEFDEFLYKTVGYDKLNRLCTGLFMSPYAATSLREYFANGLENYLVGDSDYLQKISPKLYLKLSSLTSTKNDV
jgi:hypothetical protein